MKVLALASVAKPVGLTRPTIIPSFSPQLFSPTWLGTHTRVNGCLRFIFFKLIFFPQNALVFANTPLAMFLSSGCALSAAGQLAPYLAFFGLFGWSGWRDGV